MTDVRDAGRLVRHRWPDRTFHWIMAASVLVLLGSSFLPIAGIKFAWVTLHWSAGVVLTLAVLYHIVRAVIWQDVWSMSIGLQDLRDSWRRARQILMMSGAAPGKAGKYPLLQKLYHHGIAAVLLTATVTGLMMMVRVDTPFWQRNPYWLPDQTWGVIYVVHGIAAMAALTFIMLHIYFAVRPEKLWITRSMLVGWITRAEYLEHHDPARWSADAEGDASDAAAAGRPSADTGT